MGYVFYRSHLHPHNPTGDFTKNVRLKAYSSPTFEFIQGASFWGCWIGILPKIAGNFRYPMAALVKNRDTWRIILVSKWLATPIFKPFRPFGRGTTLLRGLAITMVINHLRPSWDDPPSIGFEWRMACKFCVFFGSWEEVGVLKVHLRPD